MADVRVDEKSIGPFYFAMPDVVQHWFRPTVGEITEMTEPWRRGKALVLCTGFNRGIAIGLWTRDINDDIVEDFAGPAWMKVLDVSADDISEWGQDGAVVEKEEDR